MNQTSFSAVFPRQLRFWAFHCCLNALPSFLLGLSFLSLWRSPAGIAAMCCGVATFILLYSLANSLIPQLSIESGILARSVRVGAKIRSAFAAVALVSFFCSWAVVRSGLGSGWEKPVSVGWILELYCGLMAKSILDGVRHLIGATGETLALGPDGHMGFLKIYLMTMVEGFILSFLLILISFFAVMFLQAKERRKTFATR